MRSAFLPFSRPRGWLCLLLSGIALCTTPAHAQPPAIEAAGASAKQPDSTGALAAAERGLAEFVQRQLELHAGASIDNLPLEAANARDLATAKVAYGFELHTVAPQDIVDSRADLASLVRPTGVWRFVVRIGSTPAGLVTVQKMHGRWQAVSFGGAGLAKELDAMMTAYANADRSNVRFIRIFQAQSDLLEIVSAVDGRPRYASLRSAREALAEDTRDAHGLSDSNDLIGPLRAAVTKNMAVSP